MYWTHSLGSVFWGSRPWNRSTWIRSRSIVGGQLEPLPLAVGPPGGLVDPGADRHGEARRTRAEDAEQQDHAELQGLWSHASASGVSACVGGLGASGGRFHVGQCSVCLLGGAAPAWASDLSILGRQLTVNSASGVVGGVERLVPLQVGQLDRREIALEERVACGASPRKWSISRGIVPALGDRRREFQRELLLALLRLLPMSSSQTP